MIFCAKKGASYEFLFLAKGGGSANKTYLYQQTKSLLNEKSLDAFIRAKIMDLGTLACPPYHLALVIGGTFRKQIWAAVKKASAGYFDHFGFSLRLSTNLSGWLHGRMRNAVIDYKQDGAITNLSVTGTPISVPLVDVWAKSSDLSDAHIAAYAKQHWGGEARHYPETPENMGLPIADSEKTRSGMQNISFKHVSGNFSEGSMANFLMVTAC